MLLAWALAFGPAKSKAHIDALGRIAALIFGPACREPVDEMVFDWTSQELRDENGSGETALRPIVTIEAANPPGKFGKLPCVLDCRPVKVANKFRIIRLALAYRNISKPKVG